MPAEPFTAGCITRGGAYRVALAWLIALGAPVASGASTPAKTMPEKILLKTSAGDFEAVLHDNAAARDFAKLLPLRLTVRDYARTELIADLPQKLSREGAPDGFDPSVGDITYYAPWGNLAIFYRDAPFASGLISLGRLTKLAPTLRADQPQVMLIVPVESP